MDAKTWNTLSPRKKLKWARRQIHGTILTPETVVGLADKYYKIDSDK
jgi:hypothetical protein